MKLEHSAVSEYSLYSPDYSTEYKIIRYGSKSNPYSKTRPYFNKWRVFSGSSSNMHHLVPHASGKEFVLVPILLGKSTDASFFDTAEEALSHLLKVVPDLTY